MRNGLLVLLLFLQLVDLFMSYKAVFVDKIAQELNPLAQTPERMIILKFIYIFVLILFWYFAPYDVWMISGGITLVGYVYVVGNNVYQTWNKI